MRSSTRTGSSTSTTRCSRAAAAPARSAIEHYGAEPDLLVVRQVARRRAAARGASPAAPRSWTRSRPAASAARSAGTRSRAPRRSRSSTRSKASARGRNRSERACASGSRRWRPRGSEVRGIGPMVAIELPEQTGDETSRITREARERGLMLLSCGIYGNVIRILVPFTVGDAELEKGLDDPGGPRRWQLRSRSKDVVRTSATSSPSTVST